MADSEVTLNESDFDLDFLREEDGENKKNLPTKFYKVLIVDDEVEMHLATKLMLRDFLFEDRGLEFLDAYTAREAKEILYEHDDIALIMLDVVMEEPDAGLKLVGYIRSVLGNKLVRIILRTGQPGEAPEGKVIINYDINDYRLKTELTVQRLYTSMYQALRSYRDLKQIEKNRQNLEKIVKSSSELFTQGTIQEFYDCILDELTSFREDGSSLYLREKEGDGFVCSGAVTGGHIIAATGRFKDYIGTDLAEIPGAEDLLDFICQAHKTGEEIVYGEKGFYICNKTLNNMRNMIYIEGKSSDYDMELIKVFLVNYSLALDNYSVSHQIASTQKEMIFTLGEIIEKRSDEAVYHVRRVAEIAHALAQALGMPPEECEVVRLASTMHDVGKIGISDSILKKPGKLTEAEFEVIKTHAEIGYEIFRGSDMTVMGKAAVICRYHHERFDGKGYPEGLKGEEIPLLARLVAVVDVFDALTHKRCYKEHWSVEAAKQYLIDESGGQFDPGIVKVFMDNFALVTSVMESLSEGQGI